MALKGAKKIKATSYKVQSMKWPHESFVIKAETDEVAAFRALNALRYYLIPITKEDTNGGANGRTKKAHVR